MEISGNLIMDDNLHSETSIQLPLLNNLNEFKIKVR